jgi:hypothetical protein
MDCHQLDFVGKFDLHSGSRRTKATHAVRVAQSYGLDDEVTDGSDTSTTMPVAEPPTVTREGGKLVAWDIHAVLSSVAHSNHLFLFLLNSYMVL